MLRHGADLAATPGGDGTPAKRVDAKSICNGRNTFR
jgi:hypothetical protein